MQALDQDDLKRFFSTEEDLAAHKRIYGIDREDLEDRGPSVSPLNGVVASLAASEFMVARTGMRRAAAHIEYRGHVPSVRVRNHERSNCPICSLRGKPTDAEVERYLALDHVKERRAKKSEIGKEHSDGEE